MGIAVRFNNTLTSSAGNTYSPGRQTLHPADYLWAWNLAMTTSQIEWIFIVPEISDITGLQAALNSVPAAQVKSDWNASGTVAEILNKPTIPVQYTDEMAQDAVGSILTDSATVDFTYNDAGNTITAIVPNDAIGTAQLSPAVRTLLNAIAKAPTPLFNTTTPVTTSNTAEIDLRSYTAPAGLLNTDQQQIMSIDAGTFAAVLGTPRIRAYFGGVNIFDTGALGISILANAIWTLRIWIQRSSATSIAVDAELTSNALSTVVKQNLANVTVPNLNTNTSVFRVTGTANIALATISRTMSVGEWKAAA